MEPQIYFTEEGREVHMCGTMVAVCWNVSYKPMSPTAQRMSKPYIDFVMLQEGKDGLFIENEDSSIQGGIQLQTAQQIVEELQTAIEYLKTQG